MGVRKAAPNVTEVLVTKRNFNRVKFATQTLGDALKKSGWVSYGELQKAAKGDVSIPLPGNYILQTPVLEWQIEGVTYRLAPESVAIELPG